MRERRSAPAGPRFVLHGFLLLLVALLAVLGFVLPSAQANGVSLPDLGEASGGVLSPAEERKLGRSLLREIHRSAPLVTDPEINFYIDALGRQLLTQAPEAERPFYFLTVDNDQVNAFAMPGGILGIHVGLILEARDEAELAAVIAHEIAHVTQRHIARMFARGRDINFTTGLAILAGVLAASIDPSLGSAIMTGGMAGGLQQQLNFSRSNEAEADRMGMQILQGAGFDPNAMADFFQRLQELSRGAGDDVPEFLRTHPVTLDRISDARNRARQMNTSEVRERGPEFRWMQARMGALQDPRRTLERLRHADAPAAPERYGAAVAHLETGDPGMAREQLERIEPDAAPGLLLDLANIAVLRQEGRHEAARERLTELDAVYPNHPVVRERLARVHRDLGNHDRAIRILSDRLRRESSPRPDLLRLQADIADAAGHIAISREAMAEYFFHRAQYEEAVRQFKAGLEASDATEQDRQRIRDKLESARETAEEARG